MTRTLLSTQVVKDDQIYQLCRILSHESYQPSSVQVLYFLLQPIVQHALKHQDDIGRALRKSYGESLQITTFGDVPSLDQLESIQDLRSPWGVAVLWKDASDNRVRGRFWISTEPQARTSPDTLNRQQKWQPDEQSIRVLNTMCHSLFQPFVSKQQCGSIFFNGTNQCWTETLATFGHKVYDGICTKAARRLRLDLDSRADCPAGYRIRPLAERDIQTVIDSNKIKFTPEYVRSRQYLSVAVVNAETDELASWAMTHSDFSVGALHTASAYRRRGLGLIVVAELANVVRAHLDSNLLTKALLGDTFWMHAECEAYNVQAMNWFCSLGYEKVVDNTWTLIEFQ